MHRVDPPSDLRGTLRKGDVEQGPKLQWPIIWKYICICSTVWRRFLRLFQAESFRPSLESNQLRQNKQL